MADTSDTRDCPYCKETINADAVKCRYCGSGLAAKAVEHEGVCPFCKEEIKPGAIKCRYCHSRLGPLEALERATRTPRATSGRGSGSGSGCGCGCGSGEPRRPGTVPLMRSAEDWWACNDYCFLYTLGRGDASWDMCLDYVCGSYPQTVDIRM